MEQKSSQVLAALMAVIEDRKRNPPAKPSYTSSLFDGGVEKIGAKILEEAAEVVEAAGRHQTGTTDLVHEAADLLYHLFVMLGYCNVALSEVEAKLASRFGLGGLEEKASRPPKT